MKGYYGVAFAFFLALSDLFNLSLLKKLRTDGVLNKAWLALPMLMYGFQPLIFYFGLAHTSLTVLNLLWDVMSDVLVTVAGVFYFKEKLSTQKWIGVFFAFMAVIFLGSDGDN
jgi:drug/metabolite transporter (DMT)-like permease